MESEGVSSGEDDGILDEDMPGDVDNLLDDAELDYTEDILEEADDKHVMNNEDDAASQDTSHDVIESSSPVDVEEGEISSSEETTDKATSSSIKLKSRATDRKVRLKTIHFTSKNLPSSSSSSSMVCRHYLAGTCDWGKECRFHHPPRGAHCSKHHPPYPPHDVLHMGHVPEFLGPIPAGVAAAHFHPPMMPVPLPHMIPGSGFAAVPHPPFATPFHRVPMVPFHEPWLPPPGPRHMPPFRGHYERMAVEAGKHGSQLEESATWVRLKTKVNRRTDRHGDLRNKLKGVGDTVDDQMDSDSDEGGIRNNKSEKKSKRKLKDDRLSDVKLKHKRAKKSHTSIHGDKRIKKGETDKKDARQRKGHSEEKQKKHHSSDEDCDTMPPDVSPFSSAVEDYSQSRSSDIPTSRKKDDEFKWSFKIGDEKQRRLHEELKVVDNAIKRKIAAKKR